MSPLILDETVRQFQKLIDTTDWEKIAAQGAFETASRVYAKCPPPKGMLAGEEAATYLKAFMRLVQEDIFRQHNSYGRIRWFWYLRRVPDALFEGAYVTTLGYDKQLAEIFSSQFTANDVSQSAERVLFCVNSSVFRHVVRYIGRVKLMSQLHILYRRIGKGAVLDTSRPMFAAHSTETVNRAIKIYDTRQDRSFEFVGYGLGIVTIDPNFDKLLRASSGAEPVAFLSFAITSSIPVPATFPNSAGGVFTATVNARHILKELNLTQILSPFGPEGANPDYLPRVAALVQLLMLMPTFMAQVHWSLSSILQFGYFFIGERHASDIVGRRLPEIIDKLSPLTPGFTWPRNFIEWRDSLLAVSASTWPLGSGNVLRRFRDYFLVDTTGASHALLERLELNRSPLTGNLRAKTFELQCQDIIDNTQWKALPEISALRGRPLRRNGIHFTDIDAIGSNGKTLLIISCKSIIYDRDYDQGVFRVVRNCQTTIDEAVEHWSGIVSDLKQHPVGDNFDLSHFDEFIGIVCTPFPVYSSEERTLAYVAPNLRASSSILELRDWLDGDSDAQT